MAFINNYDLIVPESANDVAIVRSGSCSTCNKQCPAYLNILSQTLCYKCWMEVVDWQQIPFGGGIKWEERYAGFSIAAAWCLITHDRPTFNLPEHLKSFWVYRKSQLNRNRVRINTPVLLAEVGDSDYPVVAACRRAGEKVFLIDGHHRLSLAYWTKQPIKAYILSPDELEFIRTV